MKNCRVKSNWDLDRLVTKNSDDYDKNFLKSN